MAGRRAASRLDAQGSAGGYFDVHDYIRMAREHHEKVGIGAAYVNRLFR
jgi:2,4'-dihydroxyacetophenone dioxygenase